MTDAERVRLAHHEAGHAAMAHILGGRVELVTIRPGKHYRGVSSYVPPSANGDHPNVSAPLVLWPPAVRRRVEVEICTALAGPLAEELAGGLSGYRAESECEKYAAASAEDLSVSERELLADIEQNAKPPPDEQRAWDLSRLLAEEEAVALLGWLRAMTRAVVYSRRFRRLVSALVPLLLEEEVLGGARVRELSEQIEKKEVSRGARVRAG